MEELILQQQTWISHLQRPSHQIRLLQVPQKSAAEDVSIELTMSTFDLTDTLDYYAMSYTWGPAIHKSVEARLYEEDFVQPDRPSSDLTIVCNGQEVQITQSLLEGLEQIISRYPGIKLWVDALCIDQSNATEKSQQIGLMGDIYNKAESVIVWLGTETVAMYDLAHLYHGYASTPREFWRKSWHSNSSASSQSLQETDETSEHSSQESAYALAVGRGLVDRNWFLRKWTFQECVLAKSVALLCGRYKFDFDTLVSMLDLLPEPTGVSIDPSIREITWNLKAIAHAREAVTAAFPDVTRGFLDSNYGGHGFEPILLIFLLMTTDRRSSNACDEFRSLFGLADLQARRLGSLNTSMSEYLRLNANLSDYLTEVSKLIIGNHPTLTSLFFAAGWRDEFPEQPSWVIDPKVVRTRPMLSSLGKCHAGICPQSKGQTFVRFGSESFPLMPGFPREVLYVKGVKLGSKFSVTSPKAAMDPAGATSFQQDCGEEGSQVDVPAPHDTLLHLTGGAKTVEFAPGDELWVLMGAEMPFVLRPVEQCFYHLINPAYVEGVMHGEFVRDQHLSVPWEEIKIV